jgi:predicted TPR repeat methyltransferase
MFARVLKELLKRRKAPVAAPDAASLLQAGIQAEQEDRLEDALRCYQEAASRFAAPALLHTKLGNLLRRLGRNTEAIVAYREAVELEPAFAPAHNNLGVALCAADEVDEAIGCFEHAIALGPSRAEVHENLGGVYFGRGRLADSLACYREVLRTQPDNGNALHMVATMTGGRPERAADQYVAKVFDGYAERFDAHLVGELEYSAPREIAALIEQHLAEGALLDVLDLGCGTGLAGAEFSGRARQLVGVDLSRNMLEQARRKNLYTRLEESDLQGMMLGEAAASYDLILAADVFIYIGKLEGIVAEAKRLLRPGGMFGFSVEALEGAQADYVLALTGRYAHAANYLERLARDCGFRVLAAQSAPIRKQTGLPVPGHLVLWQSPGAVGGGA